MSVARLGPYRLSGMVAPMVAWALHFVAVYSLQGLACARGWDRALLGGQPAVTWALLLLTMAMLAATAAFGVRGLRAWRSACTGSAEGALQRFTAGVTALLALVALLAICFTAIPILLLQTCA